MLLAPRHRVVVVGKTGTGKSHWTGENVCAPAARVLAWDPYGEFPTRDRLSFDEFMSRPDVLADPSLSLSVVPGNRRSTKCSADFDDFVSYIESAGGYTLIVDECGLLLHAGEALNFVATQARHFGEVAYGKGSPNVGVGVAFCAQRAVQIPLTAREQASCVVAFRQEYPDDVDALRKRFETTGKASLADRVPKLSAELHEFVVWRDDE